ncbi:MAG TPA: hypothetical protein VJR47_18080 [Stellaceae bacterium]|nr:hypothetical protein [Stellaceae bacterium]
MLGDIPLAELFGSVDPDDMPADPDMPAARAAPLKLNVTAAVATISRFIDMTPPSRTTTTKRMLLLWGERHHEAFVAAARAGGAAKTRNCHGRIPFQGTTRCGRRGRRLEALRVAYCKKS